MANSSPPNRYDAVERTQVVTQRLHRLNQNLIPQLVAVVVIDPFEVIEIRQDQIRKAGG
ncbi:hypothetical protein M1R55_28205 (plasmid) [Deinococcus sp. QL22]|nr:hypothetical protein [Deinococcus sp. QL22]UQN10261.1 hypothetical protein M1R55_28205 [Deinococcus sp. QL22]